MKSSWSLTPASPVPSSKSTGLLLAAAFAQRGQFPEAIETAEQALQLATAQNKESLAEALRKEVGFYEMGLPYWSGNSGSN